MFGQVYAQLLKLMKKSDRKEKKKNTVVKKTTHVKDASGPRNQSMKDSQGKSDFSGSAYNGPGNVDHEKTNSNMSQKNFNK